MYNYVKVCNWAFSTLQEREIKPNGRLLYLYLIQCANSCFWKDLNVKVQKLAKGTGLSRATIYRESEGLRKAGLLNNGFKLNYSIFPQTTKEFSHEGIKKFSQSGIPAGNFPPEVFAEYEN